MKIFYRLEINPTDDAGEGENWDKWFTSFAKAKAHRRKLIREDTDKTWCERFGDNFAIYRVIMNDDLTPNELLLAVLNRRHYYFAETCVLPAIRY